MEVQAALPELSIEALHNRILGGFARLDKVELHPGAFRPEGHRLAGQFAAVIHDDPLR